MAEVLIIGAGGRENAIAQAMEASPEVSRTVISGSFQAGVEEFSGSLVKPFVVIGPEVPLIEGLADELRLEGYTVFGAGRAAAQYEASKSQTTKMARKAGIVHPDTFIAEGVWMKQAARAYVDGHHPDTYVIKADRIAAGKGVVLPSSYEEARAVVEGMIDGTLFDGAGKDTINFQKRHSGPEVSAMAVVGAGKEDFVILPLSQDHKRLLDGDQGPNTGGMGAYAPVPASIVNPAQYQKICEKAYASLDGMAAEGVTFERGLLYAGLMMAGGLEGEHQDDSVLIEYNVRFGDPETQAVLPLLTHAGVDVYRLLRSAAEGSLEKPSVDFANIGAAALSVCLAAEGYPGSARKGDVIYGLDSDYDGVVIQLAGVRKAFEKVRTDGGRVLYVTGVGETIDEAATRAYAAIGLNAVNFADMQYRKDIGRQARQAA
jgi:phosphoribosylamine--glycine ligase